MLTPETVATLRRDHRRPRPGKPLTRREIAVLERVALGMSNKAVGLELHYTSATVKTMVRRILIKLDAPNRAAAVNEGWRRGYLGGRSKASPAPRVTTKTA